MRFSRTYKSSNQSLPSPDGAYIATILPSKLSILETRSLSVKRVIPLPSELVVSWFVWAPSSRRILVGSTDILQVFSLTNTQFCANVTNPACGATKVTWISFGVKDDEILIFSDFGLKVSILNLMTSKSVHISFPKFYQPGSVDRGFGYRPRTANLALLTRSGGKDVISVHARDTFDTVTSWWPDTIDAQGLCWSPDGWWLAVWESASQGHKILVYTADGHLYRTWSGPIPRSEGDAHLALGPGIKVFEWAGNGAHVAVSDHTSRVILLMARSFTETMSLIHTTAVKPGASCQIWQEQISSSLAGRCLRSFSGANQTICPPTASPLAVGINEPKMGTSMMSFDASATLLATRTEEAPTTVWIWDVANRILRAVLILHAPIARITWHPRIDELLMLRCEGVEARGLMYLWDLSWASPMIIDFTTQFPGGKLLGRTICRWLNTENSHPAIFFSDAQDFILASISDTHDSPVPWKDADAFSFDICGAPAESPLNLVPALKEKKSLRKVLVDEHEPMDRDGSELSACSEEMDDTFQFKKYLQPRADS